MAPRGPQKARKSPKTDPRRPQDGPKEAPSRFKIARKAKEQKVTQPLVDSLPVDVNMCLTTFVVGYIRLSN